MITKGLHTIQSVLHGSFWWHAKRHRGYIISLLVLILTLPHCGLFETRTPEPPTQPTTAYPLATTPQILIDNFQRSLAEAAITQYLNCFVQDSGQYQFYPAADAVAQFPNLFDRWSLQQEQLFISNLSALLQQQYPQLIFTETDFEYSRTDSAVFQAQYQFLLPTTLREIPDTAAGTIFLTCVRQINGQWYILRWLDQQHSRYPSMSTIKALLVR